MTKLAQWGRFSEHYKRMQYNARLRKSVQKYLKYIKLSTQNYIAEHKHTLNYTKSTLEYIQLHTKNIIINIIT